MSDTEQHERLEIYKLHAEAADRVSQRREGANRLYVSLLVGLVVFLAALLRFGMGEAPEQLVLGGLGVLGVLLSVSWFFVIRSYRQLNTGKINTLRDLEKQLVYAFYDREWERLEAGRNRSSVYWRLTEVEQGLPIIFALLFFGLILYAFLR